MIQSTYLEKETGYSEQNIQGVIGGRAVVCFN